jgi:broad specificity phosphatase PhoE
MPKASGEMAGGKLPIVRGNSNLQPMNPMGHDTVSSVGSSMARLGGPDEIVPSSSVRAQETASDVARQTGAPVSAPVDALESRAMGQLEGEEKTTEVKRFIADTIRKQPNYRIPGQGAMSSRPGESFNEFKQRAMGAVHGLMQKLAGKPTSRILVPTSSQVIRLIKAWAAEGCPDDFAVSTDEMTKEDAGKPGEIERFFPEPSGEWNVTPFSPKSATEFQPGLYFMRHGETDGVQAKNATDGQRARAQLIAHVRAGDYGAARSVAKGAATAGHLSDDEISAAIDEALPGGQDADSLSPDELLNAATAASAAKRAELIPAMQRTFGDLSRVAPDGAQALRSHLGRLGMRS